MSLLKRCISPTALSQPLPKCLTDGWELKGIPEAIVDTRLNAVGEEEVLVKWADLPDFESSWELETTIRQSFPDFHHGDKVELQGGIVGDPKYRKSMYVRREVELGHNQAHNERNNKLVVC